VDRFGDRSPVSCCSPWIDHWVCNFSMRYIGSNIDSFHRAGTGYLGDYLILYLARRNGGYKEPEMRLWILVLSFIYSAVGYFAYGWGAQLGAPWIAIAVGICGMIAQQVATTSIATAYAMECFDEVCCYIKSLHSATLKQSSYILWFI
jgi:hypothetical protein